MYEKLPFGDLYFLVENMKIYYTLYIQTISCIFELKEGKIPNNTN